MINVWLISPCFNKKKTVDFVCMSFICIMWLMQIQDFWPSEMSFQIDVERSSFRLCVYSFFSRFRPKAFNDFLNISYMFIPLKNINGGHTVSLSVRFFLKPIRDLTKSSIENRIQFCHYKFNDLQNYFIYLLRISNGNHKKW